eukprot:1879816-Rhodomonas_salina.1
MALSLGFENSLYLPLIGLIPGHPVMEDTYDDLVFQFIVVQRAIKAGALDYLPKREDPLLDANNCNKNYRHVVVCIVSFSAQLANRCRSAFPRIFVQLDLHAVPHQLTGLRKLASLHQIFDRNLGAADSGQAWIDCFKAIAAHL